MQAMALRSRASGAGARPGRSGFAASGRVAPGHGAPGHIGFRLALPSDVEAIVALVESAYRGEPSRSGWTTEADLLDGRRTDAGAVAEQVGGPASLVLLAERLGPPGTADGPPSGGGGRTAREEERRPAGRLLGCCALERIAPGRAYFGMFAVWPTEQGRGLGAAILGEAERVAALQWKATCLEMTVIAQREDLLSWYARHGYERTGETREFPYGDERFGVPRRPDLFFLVLEKKLARTVRRSP